MFVLFCLCLGQRTCSGVGNVPLYHCGRCRLYVCLCCVCLGLQVASVSHSIIAAYAGFMLCFVCVSLCVFEPARVQLGVGNVPLYHCGHCRLYVIFCLCFFVCIWACTRAVGGVKCPALSLWPLPTLYLFVLCVSGPAHAPVSRPINATIANFIYIYLFCVCTCSCLSLQVSFVCVVYFAQTLGKLAIHSSLVGLPQSSSEPRSGPEPRQATKPTKQ